MNIVNQINFPSYSQLNPRIAYQMYDAYARWIYNFVCFWFFAKENIEKKDEYQQIVSFDMQHWV